MVFEQFLESNQIKKHKLYALFLGLFYILVSYFVADYFFDQTLSVAVVFTATLFLVPSMYTILKIEEEIESKEGLRHFFHNHKDIFEIYLFVFLGIFAAFLILSMFSSNIFDYQMDFLETRGDLELSEADSYKASFSRVSGILSQNLMVIVIAFVLSLFYGAGGIFLIVLNASVFAAFVSYLIRYTGNFFQSFFVYLIHLVPELSGFLIAAIAGGVVSRAIMKEKFLSKGFKNVMKDSVALLLISFLLIVIAAFLEVFVVSNILKTII